MTATYYILQPDGTQMGPVPQAQVLAYLRTGALRRENLLRRADLGEFFAVESYPEFAQVTTTAAPVAVPRGPASSVVRPRAATAKPPAEGRLMLWIMLLILLAILGWGAKAGWDKWQESSAEQKEAAAAKWRSENPPDYQVVNLRWHFNEFLSERGKGLVVEGDVVEKEPKIHPEYGRASRSEVYVRLALRTDLLGEIHTVTMKQETVPIRNGKGDLTAEREIPWEQIKDLIPILKDIKVTAQVRYEK